MPGTISGADPPRSPPPPFIFLEPYSVLWAFLELSMKLQIPGTLPASAF